MKLKLGLLAAVVIAIVSAGACNDNDTIVGPNATATPTNPPGTTATATPPVLTATVTPPGPTVTATPPGPTMTPTQGVRTVDVGASGGNTFVDRVSGNSTTTIPVGTTVEWVWVSGIHSTTSGTCTTTCVEDGIWDSGSGSGMTFSHTFTQAGSFPYFCEVHGAMMTGLVVVQ